MPPKPAPPAKKPAGSAVSAKSGKSANTSSAVSGKSAASNKKTAPSGPPAKMPTPEDLTKLQSGEKMTEEQVREMQKRGTLPLNIDMSMQPTMHKVKSGKDEVLVIMVDAPPCGCRKVNGKKERCRLHRKERRNKKAKKAKNGLVKDDESDRKKLGALRHAEDSDEEHNAIDGAWTPDRLCLAGPTGVAVLVAVESEGNKEAAPRCRNLPAPTKGILVLGPQDVPQFIPQEKIPMDNGKPAFKEFTPGTLVKTANGETVFYPDGGNKFDDAGKPLNIEAAGVDKEMQKKVGTDLHYAGVVDVNKAGMAQFRMIDDKNAGPQDKNALVGVLVKKDDVVHFVQTKGQAVGSGDNGALIATTKEGALPAGTVLGELIEKDGKLQCVPVGQSNGSPVLGTVIQGDFNQPILVPIKDGPLSAGTVCTAAEAAANKEVEWQKLAVADEKLQAGIAADVLRANFAVQAAILNCPSDQAAAMNKAGGAELARGCFQYQAPSGATMDQAAKAAEAGPSNEVESVAVIGGYGRSVFMTNANKEAAMKQGVKMEAASAFVTNTGAAGNETGSVFMGPK